MIACGLWLARRRLIAALVGDGRQPRLIRAALTDDSRFGLLEFLAHTGCELVATDALAHAEILPAHAARRGLVVWLADAHLVDGLLRVAAIRDTSRAAALVARVRLETPWRSQLHRLSTEDPSRQLSLI